VNAIQSVCQRTGLPLLSLSLIAVLSLSAASAHAADAWPSKAVRIIVPYSPGGAVDVATRKIAQKLGEQTGQSFVVENKPGATGTIGAAEAARATPDGYTLVANDTTYSLLPFIFKKLPFDPKEDLEPVSAFLFGPMALAVNAAGPYKTLQDLLNKAQSEPDTVTYGSGGAGTTPFFAAEGLGLAANVKFLHVPFKGAAEATQAVLSNVIDFQFSSTSGVIGNVKAGKMRLLAISGDQRLSLLPDVPTFAEAGVNYHGIVNWTGLWAPKGTPPDVLERLQKEIATAVSAPDVKTFATSMGMQPRQANAQEFKKILDDSSTTWGNVVTKINFQQH